MLQALSSLVVVILLGGFLLRNRRPIHIPLMIAAFAIDLGLVLAIELNRGAIRKATSRPSPLLLFHVLMSIIALLSYAAMATLGNAVRNGGERWRPWHKRVAWVLGGSRMANYVTSWML
jgi:hypothetical protein